MTKEEVTFRQGFDRLQAALERLNAMAERQQRLPVEECEAAFQHERLEEAAQAQECERCEEWPCRCGDPEFETYNSQQLNKAQEVD